jgi:hypothetical protein
MTNLRNALACGLLVVAIITGLQLTFLLRQAGTAIESAEAQLFLQNVALIRMEGAVGHSVQQAGLDLRGARRDLNDRLDAYLVLGNLHLSAANETLLRTGYSLAGSANEIAESVHGTTSGARQIESQVSDALQLTFDCDRNADCFHNRYVGAAHGIEDAAEAWGDAAPAQATAATATLENARAITDFGRKGPLRRLAEWLW